jgi:elongation of very long chain fatty acids protein 6
MFGLKKINTSLTTNTKEIYGEVFEFEYLFESKTYVDSWGTFMQEYWILSVLTSILYVMLIFSGKIYMKNRPKFDLRKPLIAWNMLLGLFSIFGAVRTWPELIHVLSTHGFVNSVCDNNYAYGN